MILSPASRTVRKVLNMHRTKVGTLPILRGFAGNHLDFVSPYVLFDEFGPVTMEPGAAPLRVNAHPHAGFTPTTYFLEGNGHHKDSLNYDFQIQKGDFMMFNSGRGAIHMEETGQGLKDHGGSYHGFQIWLNSPAKFKHMAPTTQVANGGNMGHIQHKQYSATVVLGELNGTRSKIETLSPAFYYHIKLKPNGRLSISTDPSHNAMVYLVKGNAELEGQKKIKRNQLALYDRGNSLLDMFSLEGAEILVLGGQPLNEPVYSYGPFVMNSKEEINQCIQNYRTGKMGDPALVN